MDLRILVDTNVILDYLLCREPYDKSAQDIIIACKEKKVSGCIAAHSVSNLFFILRKAFSIEERRFLLHNLCNLFEVVGIDKNRILSALDNKDFADFEDCLQMECAKAFHADYIITRNSDDFKYSEIPCIDPTQFSNMI